MRRRLKLLATSPARLASLGTASLLLASARWTLAFRPMAELIAELRSPLDVNPQPNPDLAKEIAWALRSASAKVPWRADCLVRAIAARHWARRSRLPFEFHLGVSFDAANA